MPRTLLEISKDMHALDDLLYELGGDLNNPQVAEAVKAWFAELDTNMSNKVDNYAAYITDLLARAATRKQESVRLAERARIDESTAGFLKGRLMEALRDRGVKRMDTARYRVSVAGNGGLQPMEIEDPDAVPTKYRQCVPEKWVPDTKAIHLALSLGFSVPGCVLKPRGTHLKIN